MMIPITRKEKYINEIVGGGDTAPKAPQTREEFFFAEILGEVIAPSPVTRVEKYLSAIARQYSGELPEPVTRIERFIARAAGMEIEIPTPITREEIFWSNYSAIVDFEVEGVPPLTYKAIEGTLENYRIYGNTVDGESVGDRTGNLFDYSSGIAYSNSTLGNVTRWDYAPSSSGTVLRIPCSPNTIYTLSISENIIHSVFRIATVDSDDVPISGQVGYIPCTMLVDDGSLSVATFTTTEMAKYLLFQINAAVMIDAMQTLMLNSGSTALPYEPYGYKVPVTVSNGSDTLTTPIYLPEPIKMVGSEAEYVDYEEQKLHRIGADDIDVALPALPTLPGTNVLSMGTAVQPSKVYVKYKGERQ